MSACESRSDPTPKIRQTSMRVTASHRLRDHLNRTLVTAMACYLAAGSALGDSGGLELHTIADATLGSKHWVDTAPNGPSQGDTFVFDQPLMNQDGKRAIGTNSGFCITTRPGVYSQCQWTLTLEKGSISVAGQEAETGVSILPIIGTTGQYATMTGELKTFPNPNGTFTQTIYLRPVDKCAVRN